MIEIASSMSSTKDGIGRISRTMMPTMPIASATSPRAAEPQTGARSSPADGGGGKSPGQPCPARQGLGDEATDAADIGDGALSGRRAAASAPVR